MKSSRFLVWPDFSQYQGSSSNPQYIDLRHTTVGSKRLHRQDTSGQFSRRVKADNGYCPQPVVAGAKLLCDAPACIVIQLDPAPTCSPVYAQTPSHTDAILPHPSPSSAAGPWTGGQSLQWAGSILPSPSVLWQVPTLLRKYRGWMEGDLVIFYH